MNAEQVLWRVYISGTLVNMLIYVIYRRVINEPIGTRKDGDALESEPGCMFILSWLGTAVVAFGSVLFLISFAIEFISRKYGDILLKERRWFWQNKGKPMNKPKGKCSWVLDEDGDFETSCNCTFLKDSDIKENLDSTLKWCPYCGEAIDLKWRERVS